MSAGSFSGVRVNNDFHITRENKKKNASEESPAGEGATAAEGKERKNNVKIKQERGRGEGQKKFLFFFLKSYNNRFFPNGNING